MIGEESTDPVTNVVQTGNEYTEDDDSSAAALFDGVHRPEVHESGTGRHNIRTNSPIDNTDSGGIQLDDDGDESMESDM